MPAPNHTGQRQNNPVVVYKRIRLPDSDSDDPASPAKKAALQVELTPAIKERRFRNMLEMFPDISPLVRIIFDNSLNLSAYTGTKLY